MTGRLKIKNGFYYIIINYKDNFGNYKQKYINTNLKERGNKKQAQILLEQNIKLFEKDLISGRANKPKEKNEIVFVEYVENYVKSKENELSPNVYVGYTNITNVMKRYFGNKLKLKDITYKHLLKYYDYLKEERGNKNITVKHHAVILSPCLRQAYRDDLIAKNPYEFMPKIKREKPPQRYYDKEEFETLFKITDKTNLALIVRVAAYYGFRRSELIGLKWDAVDFVKKTITIKHKVLFVNNNLHASNTLKTTASNRTLPLLPEIETLLLNQKEKMQHNKKIFGMSYNKKFLDYIFVNDIGDLIIPDYVSARFAKLLKLNKLKHIRFHDLRHSCASLLVANNVPMKYIQEWLGHANFNTTADVYSHLDYTSKYESAGAISKALSPEYKEEPENINDEIEELERMLAEKRKRLKEQEEEM